MELKHILVLNSKYHTNLLIVPYGIETEDGRRTEKVNPPFNRTLWN